MSILSQLLIFLIFIGSVGFVIQPLLQRYVEIPEEEADLESLKLKKQVLYHQIKELDMDYEIGNLSKEDYTVSRDDLKRQVAKVFSQIKSMTTGNK